MWKLCLAIMQQVSHNQSCNEKCLSETREGHSTVLRLRTHQKPIYITLALKTSHENKEKTFKQTPENILVWKYQCNQII